MLRPPHLPPALVIAALVLWGCRDGGRAPTLEGVADQVAAVGQELVIDLRASDPDGDDLEFDFAAGIEGIENAASITRRPDGTAVFRWTPLSADVGEWRFDFLVSDGRHSDSVTVTIDVRLTLGEGAVPVFREPLGSGTTLDLASSACLDVPVVVEDEDDTEVALAMAPPGIAGASLDQTGGLEGTWSWCPSKDQLQSDRYALILTAADGEHEPTQKNYLVVLRQTGKPDCPGEAPVIDHTPSDVASVLDIEVTAEISDDVGLKQAPLLYSGSQEPPTPIDFGALDVQEMTLVSGDMRAGSWRATLPNPVASEPEGASATIWYIVSAGDNDDPEGDCDHLTDAPAGGAFRMEVTNPGGTGGAGPCEPCSADSQCGGADDLCLALGADAAGHCAIACDTDADCDAETTCTPAESVDGTLAKQCIPDSGTCDPPDPGCRDDDREDNDALAQAAAQPVLDPDHYTGLVLCEDDDDWYRLVVDAESTVGALVEAGADTNVNLGLYDGTGDPLDVAETASSSEVVEACVGPGTYYLRVYAFGNADETYEMLVESTPDSCMSQCVDDDLEPNDDLDQATIAAVFPRNYAVSDRMICADDDDWYEIELYTGETVVVDATFNHDGPQDDLDLHFHDPAGVDLTPCSEENPSTCTPEQGQGTASNEHYERMITEPGCSPCSFYVRVHGYAGAQNEYDLAIALQ